MIQRLRRKFVWIVMAVVTLILLAIFVAMLTTTQRNNERISMGMLQQALSTRMPVRLDSTRPHDAIPLPPGGGLLNIRTPVLVIEINDKNGISTITNQLHFIENVDIAPIAELIWNADEDSGILPAYALRYLRRPSEAGIGMRIALTDISMEKEILHTLIQNALLIGGGSMLVFFGLSLFLARWAVRPVEIAWERQKQFIANASHELKTPLTVILSNADMLRTDKPYADDDAPNTHRAKHIHAEALRMKKLIEDMLTLAKSDNAHAREQYVPVDFSYIAKSAVLMYEPMAFDARKTLSYAIEDGLTVPGDKQALRQAIDILLDNALKYSLADSVIRVELCAAEGKTLLLAVENESAPIPAHELENIFLRFYRRDEARSAHGSFGLGLSIAQGIVNGHNGKIWANSDGVSRNRFCISLPVAARPSH